MAKKRQSFSVPPTKNQVVLAAAAPRRAAERAQGIETIPMRVLAADEPGPEETWGGVPGQPVEVGPTNLDYTCGGCGVVLAEGLDDVLLEDVAIECPRCGKRNVVLPE